MADSGRGRGRGEVKFAGRDRGRGQGLENFQVGSGVGVGVRKFLRMSITTPGYLKIKFPHTLENGVYISLVLEKSTFEINK